MLFLMRVLRDLCNVWCRLIHFIIFLGKDGSKPAILKIYSELACTMRDRKRILILRLRKIPACLVYHRQETQMFWWWCHSLFHTVGSTSLHLPTFSKNMISWVRKLPNLKVFGDSFWKILSSVRQKKSFSNLFLRMDWFLGKSI